MFSMRNIKKNLKFLNSPTISAALKLSSRKRIEHYLHDLERVHITEDENST